MRLTALVLGLFVGIVTFVHNFLRYVLNQLGQIETRACYPISGDWGLEFSLFIGWFMAITGLIASGLVTQFPRTSFLLFLLAAFVGIVVDGGDQIGLIRFCILPSWSTPLSWLYIICAVFAFFGQTPDRRWPLTLIASWSRRQQEKQENDNERS